MLGKIQGQTFFTASALLGTAAESLSWSLLRARTRSTQACESRCGKAAFAISQTSYLNTAFCWQFFSLFSLKISVTFMLLFSFCMKGVQVLKTAGSPDDTIYLSASKQFKIFQVSLCSLFFFFFPLI